MTSDVGSAPEIAELLLQSVVMRRDVRKEAKLSRWRRSDLEAWEGKLSTKAKNIADQRPTLEEIGRYREAYRCIRSSQMLVAEARRHFGKIWAMAENAEVALDLEESGIALRAAAALEIEYKNVRPILRRAKAISLPQQYSALRDAFLIASKDHYRLMILKFSQLYSDASPETEANLQAWLFGDGGKSLTWDQVCRLDRRLSFRIRKLPESASQALSRLRAAAVMQSAETLSHHAVAIERAQAVRTQAPYNRSFEAAFKRFLNQYVYLIHTRGTEAGVQQPLEQEHFWKAYCDNYEGMHELHKSRYWLNQMDGEKSYRIIRRSARRGEISRVSLISNTPKFSYTLADMFRENGYSFSFTPFDLVEQFYRDRRIVDLIDEHPERLPNPNLRAEVLQNPRFHDLFDADAILVDFANRAAAWASNVVRPHQKLFIRLHAYEAFSKWPYSVNWGAVDGIVYVSDAIRRLFEREMGLRIAEIPSITIPNFKRLPPSSADRSLGTHRRLGMLGAVIYRKQPVQALQILDQLQRVDSPDWELRLAGDYWPAETQSPETEHKAKFERLWSELPNPDRVKVDGFQTDIASWFSQIDFLLSASLREGTHEAVNEAMHFGAIPVVRNWPLVAEFGGAECVYPPLKRERLLYDTVDQAVEGVLRARKQYAKVSGRLTRYVGTYLDNEHNFEALTDFMRQTETPK